MTTPRSLGDAERLAREMEVARNIQRDFLPESLPMAMGVQLEAALHPAREVSGDFYDAFVLPPAGTVVLVVGDVCDKGVGAALFMALFRSLIRASADPVGGGAIQMIGGRRTLVRQALESATPADLLTRVASFTNDYIARLHGRTNMFATVFLGALDPAKRTTRLCQRGPRSGAGHRDGGRPPGAAPHRSRARAPAGPDVQGGPCDPRAWRRILRVHRRAGGSAEPGRRGLRRPAASGCAAREHQLGRHAGPGRARRAPGLHRTGRATRRRHALGGVAPDELSGAARLGRRAAGRVRSPALPPFPTGYRRP